MRMDILIYIRDPPDRATGPPENFIRQKGLKHHEERICHQQLEPSDGKGV